MTEKKHPQFAQPFSVLVIEDNQVDRKMIESMLRETSQNISKFEFINTLQSAIDCLQKEPFDVILLDLNLPDCQGEKSLTQLHKKYPDIPIVVSTGAYEDDVGLQTLSKGAQDFLIKGRYNAYVLNKVLRFAIERKRLETELKQAYEKLKETQNHLVHAEKMKVVGNLASGVAHEVKNPLATINYGVTYLEENLKEKTGKIQSVLENIKEASDRANLIVNDLLNFASLQKLQIEEENFNEIVDHALMLLNHTFEKNNIKVVRNMEKKLPEVKIDKNRVIQVILNILLNAVNAMKQGGEIVIQTRAGELDKSWLKEIPEFSRNSFKGGESVVCFDVIDHGIGLKEPDNAKIFDPFFTTKRRDGGVGLGLTVSKNIMDLHGGSIYLTQNNGGGAKATLIFKA